MTDAAVSPVELARQVADAVLYEGYLLYPYRASAGKNRVRWQFGVLMPPGYVGVDPSERSWSQTECLLEGEEARLSIQVRFLQVQDRSVEAATGDGFVPVTVLDTGEAAYVPWDEAVERMVEVDTTLAEVGGDPLVWPIELPAEREVESLTRDNANGADGAVIGRLVRECRPLTGTVSVASEALPGPYGTTRLRIRVDNQTPSPDGETTRPDALRGALVAAHVLVTVADGRFISLLDPPEWARGYAESCVNEGLFPVLAGPPGRAEVVLSAPIILYDYPQVAPESETDFYDSTEIDELLSLRTMTLTDQEKREARGTDARAAALVDHTEELPAEVLDRLHGAVRYLRAVTTPEHPRADDHAPDTPWWDPGADASVSPETDTLTVAGVALCAGSRVRLRPGTRRADAQDMFLTGRPATVAAVLFDVDGAGYFAVSVDDEVGEMQRAHGRFLYFSPDEVEPLSDDAAGEAS